jgi:hypothetical protein
MQNSMAFIPDQIEVVNVVLIRIVEAYLLSISVILKLPVRGRRNDQVHGLVRNLFHAS